MNDTGFGSVLRARVIFAVIIGFFCISVFQLFNMQILQGKTYTVKANENSIKPIYQVAPRGVFYDRYHRILVGNKPTFTLRIIPAQFKRELSPYIENILGMKPGYIDRILKQTQQYSPYIPRRIAKDVPFNVIAWYEENSDKLPGVDYVVETQRDYSYGVNASHMFGYTKEIPPDILRKKKDEYMMGDEIGFVGLEKTYENFLRGEKGVKYVLVDSRQKIIGNYKNGELDKPAIKGYDLILSIDKDAQMVAESAFVDKRGAVVAIEPSTGEILAFLSSPQYNLADFASVTPNEVWKKLNLDKDKPLFNRATMSIYSPGSTFKMVSALAALEEGIIDTNYRTYCGGGFQFGNRFFKCLHVHGTVDIETSIEKSCNTFYYQLALKIGIEKWSEYAKKLGFGKKTGVDISEESPGIVPTKEFYDKVFGKDRWPKGILVSLGIGQGELSVTPIQLAQYAAILANYGKTAKPHFLKGYVETKTGRYVEIKPEYFDVGISKHTFDIVRRAMYKVVNGAGTATNIRMPDIEIAGKTGTAQNPHGNDHAIFIGFAPYKNPKIAIAVIVENAGFGSVAAAPIARDIIKAYLKKDKFKMEQPRYLSKVSDFRKSKNEN
ncbi:penicillin-binding protein 2 [Rosettibacter firmus]|uniref:penicillin-binding protein 2 n=1 Tax=Rosettibacter firmus TaxID=3111522 RepID=UPI00336BD873